MFKRNMANTDIQMILCCYIRRFSFSLVQWNVIYTSFIRSIDQYISTFAFFFPLSSSPSFSFFFSFLFFFFFHDELQVCHVMSIIVIIPIERLFEIGRKASNHNITIITTTGTRTPTQVLLGHRVLVHNPPTPILRP